MAHKTNTAVEYKPKSRANLYMMKTKPPSVKVGETVSVVVKGKITSMRIDEDGYNVDIEPAEAKFSLKPKTLDEAGNYAYDRMKEGMEKGKK